MFCKVRVSGLTTGKFRVDLMGVDCNALQARLSIVMQNLILFLIFLGLAGYAAKVSYDKFSYDGGNVFEKNYAYPDKITVENKEGFKIQIILLGRNSSYLEFKKKDGSKFVYAISSLNEESQALVMKYPESKISDMSSYLSSGNVELKDVYMTQTEEEIRRIEAEIKRLNDKANATQSTTELRTIERRIEALIREISELRSKMADQ